ncbi:hypothetical protein [Nocardia sp. NPDC048505]|uniref:hypothetical protein n=1 Tax=unclassified Nocardia TaxID=2637762 RepID=UPI0033C883F9
MTFSAKLDFESLFGLPSACPNCGGVTVHADSAPRFQCRDCGTRWQWLSPGRWAYTEAAPEPAIARLEDRAIIPL